MAMPFGRSSLSLSGNSRHGSALRDFRFCCSVSSSSIPDYEKDGRRNRWCISERSPQVERTSNISAIRPCQLEGAPVIKPGPNRLKNLRK